MHYSKITEVGEKLVIIWKIDSQIIVFFYLQLNHTSDNIEDNNNLIWVLIFPKSVMFASIFSGGLFGVFKVLKGKTTTEN